MKRRTLLSICITALLSHALAGTDSHSASNAHGASAVDTQWTVDTQSGGGTTVNATHQQAFSLPAANMPMAERLNFSVGNSFFRNPWVTAPASTDARDGLGPLFNTNGCQNCHVRDGRGHPPEFAGDNAVSMLVRLSVPARSKRDDAILRHHGVVPEPRYGDQLQDMAIPGNEPEGKVVIRYRNISKPLADGSTATLRQPSVAITELKYGPLADNVQLSARIAPPMIGLGLLAAVPDAALLERADPDDLDGDGISGRANRVWSAEQQQTVIGRFGWKAGQPSLKQQNAAAFHGDMGLTTSVFRATPCSPAQAVCQRAPHGGDPEVSDNILDKVTFYTANLAVPARRSSDAPQVKAGQQLFRDAGCQGCHVETLRTGPSRHPWLQDQVIHPYTDLLLHDMGEGLADHRDEFLANGREWRTPPLWGIGLTERVSGKAFYLHDGRARSLLEAILWHDGEAASSRVKVEAMSQTERDALIAFLKSL